MFILLLFILLCVCLKYFTCNVFKNTPELGNEFHSPFYHYFAGWPWESHLTSVYIIYKMDDNVSKFCHHNSPLSFSHHVSHSDKQSGKKKTKQLHLLMFEPILFIIIISKKAWAQQATSSLARKGWLTGDRLQMGRSSQVVRESTVQHGPILTNQNIRSELLIRVLKVSKWPQNIHYILAKSKEA